MMTTAAIQPQKLAPENTSNVSYDHGKNVDSEIASRRHTVQVCVAASNEKRPESQGRKMSPNVRPEGGKEGTIDAKQGPALNQEVPSSQLLHELCLANDLSKLSALLPLPSFSSEESPSVWHWLRERNALGETPLLFSLRLARLETASWLLARRCCSNCIDTLSAVPSDRTSGPDQLTPGESALIRCCRLGLESFVPSLVRLGINIDLEDTHHHRTALWFAAQNGLLSAAEILLAGGASVDKEADDGSTPLLMAARNNHLNLAILLVKNGADLSRYHKHRLGPTAEFRQKLWEASEQKDCKSSTKEALNAQSNDIEPKIESHISS